MRSEEAVSENKPSGRAYWFLALAFLISAFNLGDRLVIGVVAEPIKHEFGLSDTLVGLLGGSAFGLIYPPIGLPLAWLADRFDRTKILSVCIAFWSAMTAACAFTVGFWGLVLARMGVAVGESGYAPATHALVAQFFPERSRARAYSLIVAGGAVGTFAATAAGGWLASRFGWRAAFLGVGAPGLLLAAVVALTVRDPSKAERAARRRTGGGAVDGLAVYLRLLKSPVYMLCISGSALHLIVTYSMATWTAAFAIRTFHLPLAQAGLIVGASGLAGGVGGALAGGWIGDRLAVRDRRWLAWWPALTVFASIPFGVGAFTATSLSVSVACIFVAGIMNTLYQSSTYALVQGECAADERAAGAALMILVQNVVGLGLGPLLVGALSDALRPEFGVRSLGVALAAIYGLNLLAAALYLASARAMGRAATGIPREVS